MRRYLYLAAAIGMLTSCSITRPYTVTNNPIGTKKGVSKTTVIFGGSGGEQLAAGMIVTNKNFGVIEAAKKGKIEKIGCVDVKTTNFWLFQKVEVIVTGE
ncbi:MAG: TRL-like family protein [Flavobacteriales bacterium]|jgi:hypothetical protein|nr:TRL-like family protein [Flavobacteriales bacterium]